LATANNTQNVSTGKGVAGGYLFSAPRTTEVLAALAGLSDLTSALPNAFVNVGYVASDGIVESESVDTSTATDMNGDPIDTSRSNRTETERVKLVEIKRDALAEQYGHSNVTDASGLITAHHNNAEHEHRVYVAELLLKDGRRWRKVIPDGQVTEVSDLTINSSEIVGREVTISCNTYTWVEGTGSAAVTHADTVIDYIESTETSA
jgi:hypothetical protein